MGGEHAPVTDRGAAQHTDLGADPAVRTDAHRRLDDPLVLDRNRHVVVHVVEVADVDPIGDDRGRADLHVEVAVDGVVAPEDDLVAHPQRALVGSQAVLVAEMHPAAEDEACIAGTRVDVHAPTQEHHALGDHRGVQQSKSSEPGVAQQIPGSERAGAQHPRDRRRRHELRLTRVAWRQPAHLARPRTQSLQQHAAHATPRLAHAGLVPVTQTL